MDLQLTPEQELMRESTRDMVERDIKPIIEKRDPNTPLSKADTLQVFQILARHGLCAPRIPEAAGGSGLKMLDYGVMFEQLPCAVAMDIMAQDGCITRLNAECNDEQKRRILPDLIAAKKIGCTGTTEPESGSDVRGIKTKMTRNGDTLILNGRKMWISNSTVCDFMIVTCLETVKADERPVFRKVIVEREKSPFEARETPTIGLKQGHLGEVVFDNCKVSAANLIESDGDGTRSLSSSWNVNRAIVALQAVNLAQIALDEAINYSKTRRQFGKLIGGHQLIQRNLSDIETTVTAARLLAYDALSAIDHGMPGVGEAARAKRFAQVHCSEAIWEAMNILGAMGVAVETRLEQLYRDIRMLAIPDGTNEILALIHGRELTGFSAFRNNTTQ
jgi:alkylation response protein AidB-like acyl-CoA dehydrogenase